MGWEAAEDALVDALRLLVQTSVNDALCARYEANPIASTYGYPITLESLDAVRLPALAVYRVSDGLTNIGRRNNAGRTQMALDYFGPTTPLHQLGERWPLLHEVWAQILAAVCSDSVTINGTALTPLTTAGVVDLIEGSAATAYSFAVGGSGAIPFAAGRLTFDVIEATESTAVPFRELLTTIDLYDDDGALPTGAAIVVDQAINNTGFDPRAFSVGFGS